MRNLLVLMLVLLAAPAGAALTEDEPSNNEIATAAIQIVPAGAVSSNAGMLSFTAGGDDSDYLGIAGLMAGDIVMVSTTPLGDPPYFEIPDTIVGLFDDLETAQCVGDDAFNNDLDQFPTGFGSLCRVEILTDGDYFVGVTGYSPVPFDGDHLEVGEYALSVTVIALPEPGMMLQLASGLLGLLALHARRRRANR